MSAKANFLKSSDTSFYKKVCGLFGKSWPVYYIDPAHRSGIVKEYPDGRKELVTYRGSEEIVLREV